MGFFNSNKNRQAIRKLNSGKRYNSSNKRSSNDQIYVTKKQAEAQQLGFTGYSIKYGDILLLADPIDIIPEYLQENTNIIGNNVFDGIRCDKIGIVYSPKQKKFMFLAMNDDYTLYILFKSDDLYSLPKMEYINLDDLDPNIRIVYNVNRLFVSVYNVNQVYDLTSNPILTYSITEIFKK